MTNPHPNLSDPTAAEAMRAVEWPDPTARYWTKLEAARYLTISQRFITRMISEGLLPATRFGRAVRIKPADVIALAEAADREPIPGRPSRRG